MKKGKSGQLEFEDLSDEDIKFFRKTIGQYSQMDTHGLPFLMAKAMEKQGYWGDFRFHRTGRKTMIRLGFLITEG